MSRRQHKMASQEPRHIKSTVAANIKARRAVLNLSQNELAQQLGVDPQYVSRWERALVLPAISNMVRLSIALACDVAWFYVDHSAEDAVAS